MRKVIHAFNERGFASLGPEARGGRPRRITAEQRARIITVAGARPDTLGVPATRWSLKRLARYLREQRIVEVSPAHRGRILAAAGLSFQRTRTWKASPDPDYEAKAARVLALYAQAPKGGVVISFDQMGPISLRPMAGASGRSANAPNANARPTTAGTAPATSSVPTTCTPIVLLAVGLEGSSVNGRLTLRAGLQPPSRKPPKRDRAEERSLRP